MPINPLFDPATDNAYIDPSTQAKINQLHVNPQGFSSDDETFLYTTMEKIKNGTINLYQPSSLLNLPVYEKLSPELQGKADQNAVILLTKLREIHNFWKVTPEPTYAIQNLIHAVRVTKERLEHEGGDVYII